MNCNEKRKRENLNDVVLDKTDFKEAEVYSSKYERKNSNELHVSSCFSNKQGLFSNEITDSSVSVIEGAKLDDVKLLTHSNCLCGNHARDINASHNSKKTYDTCDYSLCLESSLKDECSAQKSKEKPTRKKGLNCEHEDSLKHLSTFIQSKSLPSLLIRKSQNLNESWQIDRCKMNFFRSRFQRSTSYDHERGLGGGRTNSSTTNNTDQLLKEIRRKRMESDSIAAQNVSSDLFPSMSGRAEKTVLRKNDEKIFPSYREAIDKDRFRPSIRPRISSPKPIPSNSSNQTSPLDMVDQAPVFHRSHSYASDTSSYLQNVAVESPISQHIPSWKKVPKDAKEIDSCTSTNERLSSSLLSPPLETPNTRSPKWYVELSNTETLQNKMELESSDPNSNNCSQIITRDEEKKSFEAIYENPDKKPIEEYSISINLILNKNKPSGDANGIESKVPFDDSKKTSLELRNAKTDNHDEENNDATSAEVSTRRRRRPENRKNSSGSKSNSGTFRRRRRRNGDNNSPNRKLDSGGSRTSSFRRRRRSKEIEGSDDDANPFTKRNFDSEQQKKSSNEPFSETPCYTSSSVVAKYEIEKKNSQDQDSSSTSQLPFVASQNNQEEIRLTGEAPKVLENDAAKMPKPIDHQMPEPLNCIEIKSAAQWKAMSDMMTWNFESVQEEQEEDVECIDKKENKKREHKTSLSTTTTEGDNSKRAITYKLSPNDDICNPVGFTPVEAKQLRLICWRVKPWKEAKSRKLFSSQFGEQWGVDCDEVYQGLFIGDKATASNIKFLNRYGITHVLNTAEGKDEGLVDLSDEYFEGSGIRYLGFPLWDNPSCNLLPYFGVASEFIDDAMSRGGKCLVNCQMGVSRSASCAIAYMMIKEDMGVKEVLTLFRKSRDCRPNDG